VVGSAIRRANSVVNSVAPYTNSPILVFWTALGSNAGEDTGAPIAGKIRVVDIPQPLHKSSNGKREPEERVVKQCDRDTPILLELASTDNTFNAIF